MADKKDTYSSSFAFAYIFNLIVGLGALSLPNAFSGAGYILGIVLMVVLCVMSYVTATYVIEAMAAANAYVRLEAKKASEEEDGLPSPTSIQSDVSHSDSYYTGEKKPLLSKSVDPDQSVFEITEKFELGTMANMFYHPVGIVLYYVCVCLYLFGDLSIYVVAIPTSIRTVVCPDIAYIYAVVNSTTNASNVSAIVDVENSTSRYCFGSVTYQEAYYIFLSIVVVLLAPWSFFNLQKTKVLQLITTVMRNIALTLMIVIALYHIFEGVHVRPAPVDFTGFPAMFGVSIYAFMCHHSLPGMITPMKSKRSLFLLLGGDFMLILALYLLLSCVGAFWLENPNPLFTLDFFTPWGLASSKALSFFGYYLALFPVFTLSTNVPIISITLRENIKSLFRYVLKRWIGDREFPFVIDRLFFPVLAILPPIAVAYATQQLKTLVSVTGSFPGIGVQYFIPLTLVFTARRALKRSFGVVKNPYQSPFPFKYWWFLVVVAVWGVISVMLVAINYILKWAGVE